MSWRPPDWDAKAIVQGVTGVLSARYLEHEQIFEAAADAILKALEDYGVKARLNRKAFWEFDNLGGQHAAAEGALSDQLLKMGCPHGTKGLLAFIPEEKSK